MEKFKMWDIVPGDYTEEPDIEYYKAENKKGRGEIPCIARIAASSCPTARSIATAAAHGRWPAATSPTPRTGSRSLP